MKDEPTKRLEAAPTMFVEAAGKKLPTADSMRRRGFVASAAGAAMVASTRLAQIGYDLIRH